MNSATEWFAALGIVCLIVFIMLGTAVFFGVLVTVITVLMVYTLGADMLAGVWRWLSSLFSFPKGRRTREEED